MASLDRTGDDCAEDVVQEGSCLTVADHAEKCNSLFQECMILQGIVLDPTIIDDQRARFATWTSDMDVYGPLHGSLDYRLRYVPSSVELIHQLLDVICDTLSSLKPLNDLSRGTRGTRTRMPEYNDPEELRKDEDGSSDAVTYLNQAEENAFKITERIGGTLSRLIRLSKAARELAKANRNHSYAESVTEAPRTKSALVDNKLSFPTRPLTPECPYCGVIIELEGSNEASTLWQNYVVADLEPFICVPPACLEASRRGTGALTFGSSEAGISHMQNAHGQIWECRAPSHDLLVFDQEAQYPEHLIREHDVPVTHVMSLSGAARRSSPKRIVECPFGEDVHPSESVERSAVFESEALQSHWRGQ
ncbi:hypothetical protein HDV57DRAFT_524576 [Trichoderma longibrachiatum]|uniref:Uncharacterized protein n=1 Tax=Trichoderma longibrachiatum ATCC 18648 TaxID=983965 RepID=A0A2T4BPT3_TRILO|nr:hypothetical protein M440DRAFT_1466407 [Trichoderma longibrachiatum ATCC 18648]